jgi:hypothetical protein
MALQTLRRLDLRATLAASMGLLCSANAGASAKVIDLMDLHVILFRDFAKGCPGESKRSEDCIDLKDV